MSIKAINKILKSDLFLPILNLVLIIIGGYILLLKPLFIIPAAIIITFLSIIIYKREILLPERHNPKAWIDSIFLIVVGLFFISLIKNQVIINQFGELFIDGGIKDFDRLSEGENGNEFWEEVSVFIPDTPKGARLLSFIEYIYWGISALLVFINYKLFDYETEKVKSELWFISGLIKHFEINYNWTRQAVPTIDFLALQKYYSTIDYDKNWQLSQKINLQLSIFRIEHYKERKELPDCWESNTKSCLCLAEIVIANTVFHFKHLKSKTTQNSHHLPYEKSLIVKAIAYYIHALKKNFKECESRSEKIGLISQLYKLFYFIQEHIKAPGGKESRNLSTVLKEDVFYTVTSVIIVDDHKLFRMGIKNYLSKNKSLTFIHEAENGQELIKLLNHSTADVISLGIQMPVMHGLEFLEQFNYQEEPKIVSLSFLNDPKVVIRALKLGASSYIDKSQGGEIITKAYKQVHSYGFYYSYNIREAINKLNES